MQITATARRALAATASAPIITATAAAHRSLSAAAALYDPPADLIALIEAGTVITAATIIAGGA